MASPPFRVEKLSAKQTDEGVFLLRAAGVVSPYDTSSVACGATFSSEEKAFGLHTSWLPCARGAVNGVD